MVKNAFTLEINGKTSTDFNENRKLIYELAISTRLFGKSQIHSNMRHKAQTYF